MPNRPQTKVDRSPALGAGGANPVDLSVVIPAWREAVSFVLNRKWRTA